MREIKLIIVLILLMSVTNLKSQSTATADVTATIVENANLSSNQSLAFEIIKSPSVFEILFGNADIYLARELRKKTAYNSMITVADFVISVDDVYSLTIPKRIFATNASGTGIMAVELLPVSASQSEVRQNSQKQMVINAQVQIKNEQATGRYASQPFDVTVNFN